MANPVADAERAKFGEVAVVENQYEMSRLISQALEHMTVSAWEVPDVARFEIVGLGAAAGIDHGGPHAAVEYEGPFGGGGVPMHFAHCARLQDHRNTGDTFGNRQLLDGRFPAHAAADHLADR